MEGHAGTARLNVAFNPAGLQHFSPQSRLSAVGTSPVPPTPLIRTKLVVRVARRVG
jgi:hypothetical protein